jgi:hypothetical protein
MGVFGVRLFDGYYFAIHGQSHRAYTGCGFYVEDCCHNELFAAKIRIINPRPLTFKLQI